MPQFKDEKPQQPGYAEPGLQIVPTPDKEKNPWGEGPPPSWQDINPSRDDIVPPGSKPKFEAGSFQERISQERLEVSTPGIRA